MRELFQLAKRAEGIALLLKNKQEEAAKYNTQNLLMKLSLKFRDKYQQDIKAIREFSQTKNWQELFLLSEKLLNQALGQ